MKRERKRRRGRRERRRRGRWKIKNLRDTWAQFEREENEGKGGEEKK